MTYAELLRRWIVECTTSWSDEFTHRRFIVEYANPAAVKALTSLEPYLPIKAGQLVAGKRPPPALARPLEPRSPHVAIDRDAVHSPQRLQERELQFTAIFEHTSDVMLLLAMGLDGVPRVAAANRRFVERIGNVTRVDETQLIGLTFEALTLDVYKRPALVFARYQATIERVIETRVPLTFEHSVQVASKTSTTEVSLVPIYDGEGTLRYLLWRARDLQADHPSSFRL